MIDHAAAMPLAVDKKRFLRLIHEHRAPMIICARTLGLAGRVQLICGVLLTAFSARFWINHVGVAHLMIYGLSLHVYGVMFIIFAARDLFLIQRLDYAVPVLALQRQIAELRNWHLRAALWFGVAGCFIWIPLMLVIFYGLGADVWGRNPDVVGWLVLSGFVCLGIFYGIVRWSRRPGKEKFAKILRWTVQPAAV